MSDKAILVVDGQEIELPERRFLQRNSTSGDGRSDEHVHRLLCDWPTTRLDRPLEGTIR